MLPGDGRLCAAGEEGHLGLLVGAEADDREVLERPEAVLEAARADDARHRPVALPRAQGHRRPGGDLVGQFDVLFRAGGEFPRLGRSDTDRHIEAVDPIALLVRHQVDDLANGPETRGVEEHFVARFDGGLPVGRLIDGHGVFRLDAAKLVAPADHGGNALVAAVAEIFIGRPRLADAGRGPGATRGIGHRHAVLVTGAGEPPPGASTEVASCTTAPLGSISVPPAKPAPAGPLSPAGRCGQQPCGDEQVAPPGLRQEQRIRVHSAISTMRHAGEKPRAKEAGSRSPAAAAGRIEAPRFIADVSHCPGSVGAWGRAGASNGEAAGGGRVSGAGEPAGAAAFLADDW